MYAHPCHHTVYNAISFTKVYITCIAFTTKKQQQQKKKKSKCSRLLMQIRFLVQTQLVRTQNLCPHAPFRPGIGEHHIQFSAVNGRPLCIAQGTLVKLPAKTYDTLKGKKHKWLLMKAPQLLVRQRSHNQIRVFDCLLKTQHL